MLRSCANCGRIHDTKFDCGKKPKRMKYGDRESEKVRNSYRWATKRNAIKERDHFLCRWCLARGILTTNGLEAHHIVPIAEDESKAYDDEWIITLCGKCHEKAERGEIERKALYKLANEEIELPSNTRRINAT